MIDADILFSTIAELGARLKKREFSSFELTRAYLDRLRDLGPRFNSVAHATEDIALRQAEASDRLFARGEVKSPLQGIPYGAKDLLATRGAPTRWGAEPFRNQQFDYNATVIRKLAAAGSPLAAKLSMVRFAGGGGYEHPTESLHGPGRNPWNSEFWSGGSSSGPGSAVAAALTPFAIGSETWGSIISPCSYCGITGLRPTYGLVSRYGAMALSWTMDKLGPMCRSAEDCALVLEAISGPDEKDPASAGRRFLHDKPGPPLDGLNAGFSKVDFEEWAEPESRPAFEEALRVLRQTGLELRETALPEMPYRDVARTMISSEAATVFEDLIRSPEFDALPDERQKASLRAGLDIPATEYLRAMRIRRLIQGTLRHEFTQVDLFVTPSTRATAPPVQPPPERDRSLPELQQRGNIDLGAAGNLAGLPSLTLPCGFGKNDLPVSLTFVGAPFAEATLVALGKEFQNRTDWHRRRPPV